MPFDLTSASITFSNLSTLTDQGQIVLTLKVIAIALPMPDSPAVIKTFRDI